MKKQELKAFRASPDKFTRLTKSSTLLSLRYGSGNERGRKNKSKEAARNRRNNENGEFKELAFTLPLQREIIKQLDKASIIRLTINSLKLRHFFDGYNASHSARLATIVPARQLTFERNDFISSVHACINGFLFILCKNTNFLYVSESVSSFLGLSQVAMIGTSILDYVHEDDQLELASHLEIPLSALNGRRHQTNQARKRCAQSRDDMVNLSIRFKSTLAKKALPNKYSGWRLMRMLGRVKRSGSQILGFFGVSFALESNHWVDSFTEASTFIMRLNMNYIIESVDRIPSSIRMRQQELLRKSIFHIVHPAYLDRVVHELETVKEKEQNTFKFEMACSEDTRSIKCNCVAFISQQPSETSSATDAFDGPRSLTRHPHNNNGSTPKKITVICDLEFAPSVSDSNCLDIDSSPEKPYEAKPPIPKHIREYPKQSSTKQQICHSKSSRKDAHRQHKSQSNGLQPKPLKSHHRADNQVVCSKHFQTTNLAYQVDDPFKNHQQLFDANLSQYDQCHAHGLNRQSNQLAIPYHYDTIYPSFNLSFNLPNELDNGGGNH